MHQFHLRLNALRRQTQVRQRVPGMGITPVLANDDVRREGGDDWWQQRFNHLSIGIVFGKWFQGNVDGVAAPGTLPHFKHITGAREKIAPGFVQRDGHNAGLVVKGPLYAITVMRVEVDVEDFRLARSQDVRDSHSGIVINTEARGAICPGMMQATAGMKDMQGPLFFRSEYATLRQAHDGAHRHQCPPDDARCNIMHPRQHRGIAITEAVARCQTQTLFLHRFSVLRLSTFSAALSRCTAAM